MQDLTNFNSYIPFALFPVKVQTRFMTIKHVTKAFTSSMVYDSSSARASTLGVSSSMLSAVTVFSRSAKADGGLLPWLDFSRDLLNKSVLPSKVLRKVPDANELWIRIYPDDIFVQSHEEALTEGEQQAGRNYWQEIHKTKSERDAHQYKMAAWTQLFTSYQAHRAAWIIRQTTPYGHRGTRTSYRDEAGKTVSEWKDILPSSLSANYRLKHSLKTKSSSWSKAPYTRMLPSCFVAMALDEDGKIIKQVKGRQIPDQVQLGIDPSDAAAKIEQGEDAVELPAELEWMTDFDAAVAKGLAIKMPLSTAQASEGFDKLIVLGVKEQTDKGAQQDQLEELLNNHYYKNGSLEIFPSGSPTNSSGASQSERSSPLDTAESAYEYFVKNNTDIYPSARVTTTGDHQQKSDGQRLADALGLPNTLMQKVAGSDREDISNALAMNRLLWPGTLGYFLYEFFEDQIGPNTRKSTGNFMKNYVLGGGHLPSIKIGRQPYGFIPTTSFSKLTLRSSFYKTLFEDILQPLDEEWDKLLDKVPQLGITHSGPKSPTDVFLEILSLQASSTTYDQRLVVPTNLLNNDSISSSQNLPEFLSSLGLDFDDFETISNELRSLIQSLGLGNTAIAFFYNLIAKETNWLRGSIVDPAPPSPDHGLQKLKDENKNYLEWLESARLTDLEEEKSNDKNIDPTNSDEIDPAKTALMYYLVRHAMERLYADLSDSIVGTTGGFLPKGSELFLATQNYFSTIKKKRVGSKTLVSSIESRPEMQEFRDALRQLKDQPTAQLERIFTEQLDCCHYRLDAWMLGLVYQRLTTWRRNRNYKQGTFLGAYGYLEDVRPNTSFAGIGIREVTRPSVYYTSRMTIVRRSQVVIPAFNRRYGSVGDKEYSSFASKSYVYLGQSSAPLVFNANLKKVEVSSRTDNSNQGFIPAPSLGHAITAAVLQSAYQVHGKGSGSSATDPFAINLNAPRVRDGLFLLQGVQQGQELAHLLGYVFERGLHEKTDLTTTNLNVYLKKFRDQYPAQVNAGNGMLNDVVDGLQLLEDFRDKGWSNMSWVASSDRSKIQSLIEQVEDQLDAVSDLLLAESVYQLTQGRPEASSAALRILNEGGHIRRPEIVDIPRHGFPVQHKVAILFPAAKTTIGDWSNTSSPRSKLSPRLNHWLSTQLPDPSKIELQYHWTDESGEQHFQTRQLSELSLRLQPIDWVYLTLKEQGNYQSSVLANVLKNAIRKVEGLPNDQAITLDADAQPATNKINLFMLEPLLCELGQMVQRARPSNARDFVATTSSSYEKLTPLYSLSSLANALNQAKTSFAKSMASIKGEMAKETPNWNQIKTWTDALAADGLTKGMPDPLLWQLEAAADSLQTWLAQLLKIGQKTVDNINALQTAYPSIENVEQQFKNLQEQAKQLFPDGLRLFPDWGLGDRTAYEKAMGQKELFAHAGPLAIEEWLQSLLPVRPELSRYQQINLLRGLFTGQESNLAVLQLPYQEGASWAGVKLPEGYELDGEHLSLAVSYPKDFSTKNRQAGMLIDSWTEHIPLPQVDTGIAIHYDQANSEAPNAVLLAVNPVTAGKWTFNDLKDAVNDTFQMAKKRAIDPNILASSTIGPFLPALYAAIAEEDVIPTLDWKILKFDTTSTYIDQLLKFN